MQLRQTLADLVRGHRAAAEPDASHLRAIAFAPNPGGIAAWSFVPDDLLAGAPLVVALHGCTQSAAGYDHGTGWSTLARAHGFAVLLPEQASANNGKRCWNWFEPGDAARDRGEAASIRAAVARMVVDHRLDPGRVFVTGLSAGGAMAAVLLASYPEVFAGGGIIAGLPQGAAHSVPEAFEAMSGRRARSPEQLAASVRSASSHRGPWPRVAIWQGGADHTVNAGNAEQLEAQWTTVAGLSGPFREDQPTPGHRRRRWRGADGTVVVETHGIAGLAHGVPIAAGNGQGRAGAVAPHIFDVGVSSTHEIAAFFGVIPEAAAQLGARRPESATEPRAAAEPGWGLPPELAGLAGVLGPKGQESGPGAVIRKALSAAGLLKS